MLVCFSGFLFVCLFVCLFVLVLVLVLVLVFFFFLPSKEQEKTATMNCNVGTNYTNG